MNSNKQDTDYSLDKLRIGTTELGRQNSDPVLPIEKPKFVIPNNPPPKVLKLPEKLKLFIQTNFPQEKSPLSLVDIENIIKRYIEGNKSTLIDRRSPEIIRCQHTILEEILCVPHFHLSDLRYYILKSIGGNTYVLLLE